MAMVPAQFYDDPPGTTDTLCATVPSTTTWIVKQIVLTNTTTAPATVTIGLNAGSALAAGNHLLSGVTLSAKQVVVLDLHQILATTETIRALQGTANAIVVRIAGLAF